MENHNTLLQQLTSLTNVFCHLGDQLSQVVKEFQDPGLPFPEKLFEALQNANQDFAELGLKALELAESLKIASISNDETVTSLKDIQSLLQVIAETEKKSAAYEEVRQYALKILDRVLAIGYDGKSDFIPLSQCQFKAGELRGVISDSKWPDTHPEAEAMAEGRHPFSELLTLAENWNKLDSDRWKLTHDAVAQSFGQSMASEAARGKLLFLADEMQRPVSTSLKENNTHLASETTNVSKVESQVAETNSTEEKPVAQEITPDEALPISETVTLIKKPIIQAPPLLEADSGKDEQEEEANEENPPIKLNCFLPNDTAQEIAAAILAGKTHDRTIALRDLIWRLLSEDKLGLAFHLSRCLETQYPELQPRLPSWLIRMAALGQNICSNTGEIARLLKNDFRKCNDSCFAGEKEWDTGMSLILAAAALQPALLAPDTGASTILHLLHVKEGLSQFYAYCQIIANYGDKLNGLNPNAIKNVKDSVAWQDDLNLLEREIESWWSKASTMTTKFGPATRVWRKWQEPGGLIFSLLHPVQENDINALEKIKQEVKQLSDGTQIRHALNQTAREILERPTKKIIGTAFSQIHRRVREAIALVVRWIDLQQSRPAQNKSILQEQTERLQREILGRQQALRKELDSFARKNPSLIITGGMACCKKTVQNLGILFDPGQPYTSEEPDPRRLLHADLLKIPLLTMNAHWEPEEADQVKLINIILNALANGDMDWQQAFEGRKQTQDHEATSRIIEYLEVDPKSSIDLNTLRRARENHIAECRKALQTAIDTTIKEIAGAVALNLLKEKEYAELSAKISTIEMAVPTTLRFFEKHVELQSMLANIEVKRKTEIMRTRQRLQDCKKNGVQLGSEHPAYNRISSALEQGDVLTANDYIAIVEKGQDIPESQQEKDFFGDFFPKKAGALADFIEQFSPKEIIEKVRNRENFCGINIQQVSQEQADQAAEMLSAWLTAKGKSKFGEENEENIEKILANLGFDILRMRVIKTGRCALIEVDTITIREKSRCPVSFYGANAKGEYRILCVWDRPNPVNLLHDIGETSRERPLLVFYFGCLTEQMRRDLALECRSNKRTFIVVDDALLLYLCGESASRLRALFECTLPFTYLIPYITTSSFAPPEIFYGRSHARNSILEPMGTCIIFGGRLLGKTALLKNVQEGFHNPEHGKVVLYLDLKYSFGRDRPNKTIWEVFAEKLKELKILSRHLPSSTGVDKLMRHIQSWLNEDTQRHILFLLDEADGFLESDGENDFEELTRIKELMVNTERRFKVVFAGLQDVIRSTHAPNNPLPQLGSGYGGPICIGPLLENGEPQEARYLIERPLASLGYRFESPDLITRILWKTNYYPSLIQLYCYVLLKQVTDPRMTTFESKTSLPYTITSWQVENTFESEDFRRNVELRFSLTLQADLRYEIIAYAMALDALTQEENGMFKGYPLTWIQEQALTWWPEGFRGRSSENDILVLLKEMIEMGVIEADTGRYRLRSPDIISLLGTEEEILVKLSKDRELPLKYDPATFRSAFGSDKNKDRSRRNPLTAYQVSELLHKSHGVAVIFGSRAAGLDELEPFLKLERSEDSFIHVRSSDQAIFSKLLDNLVNRTIDDITLVLVSPECAWHEDWVKAAVQRLSRLTSQKSFVRVIFVANPKATWQLVNLASAPLETLFSRWENAVTEFNGRFTNFSLGPWHDAALRQWLDDCDFKSDKAIRESLVHVTGNWPILLNEFYRHAHSSQTQWQDCLQNLHDSLNDRKIIHDLDLVHAFGLDIDTPLKVLHDMAVLNEEILIDDLTNIIEGVPSQIVNQCLRWAELLDLINPAGQGYWHLDPVVSRILGA